MQNASAAKFIRFERTEHKGLATFAGREIPKGTRILSESPLLELPPPGMNKAFWAQDVMERFEALPKDKQNALLNLHCELCRPLSIQLVAEVSQPRESSSKDKWSHDVADAQDFSDGSFRDIIRLASTFQINAFGLSGEGVHNAHVAVFEHGSRINHSCVPNTWHSWNAKTAKHNFHASRDIAADEEITTEYVDSIDIKGNRMRNIVLYGFECRCDACGNDESEATRVQIQYLMEEEFGQSKQQFDAGGTLSYQDIDEALETIRELVALFDAAGSVGIHQVEMSVLFLSTLSSYPISSTVPLAKVRLQRYNDRRISRVLSPWIICFCYLEPSSCVVKKSEDNPQSGHCDLCISLTRSTSALVAL